MNLWQRFKNWMQSKCESCGKTSWTSFDWPPNCMGCWEVRVTEDEHQMREQEREQRINELTEALRRAYPNGPYR